MVVEARIRLQHEGCYSQHLPPGVRVLHVSGDAERCFSTVTAPHPAQLDAVVDAMSAWLDSPVRVLERSPTSIAVECRCPTQGLTPRIAAWGATVLWPVVHAGGEEWWHLVAPSRAQMREVLRRLEAEGIVHVDYMGTAAPEDLGPALPLGELMALLSPGQYSALRLALDRGYYRIPRGIDLASLAREAGVSRSTFQEHLQKAERLVLERFGAALSSSAASGLTAKRTAGRPPGRVNARRTPGKSGSS